MQLLQDVHVGGRCMELLENNRTAALFESGNFDELSKTLIDLLNDEKRRAEIGERARMRVLEDFTVDTMALKYDNLYRAITEST